MKRSAIDVAILAVAQPSWQKVAAVIVKAAEIVCVGKSKTEADYHAIASRIHTLVQEGHLMSQGDLDQWRHSEVRLTPTEHPNFEIRPLLVSDYDHVYRLWSQTAGMSLHDEDDSRERIELYLKRNPGLCFVAVAENRVVGAVLCGHDGRRGILRHLAVEPRYRNQGIARELIAKVIASLREQGINKCNIYVLDNNAEGLEFWKHFGARLVDYDWRTFQLDLQRISIEGHS